MEEWRKVDGFPDYSVSSYGRVRRDGGGNRPSIVRILQYGRKNGKYLSVTLSLNSIPREIAVHRLVLETFIPNPLGLPEGNHKDADKHNNYVTNLEWVTKKEMFPMQNH